MDTSKEYIKQCEKAEEVQAGWVNKEADVVAYYFDGKTQSYLQTVQPSYYLQDPKHYSNLRAIWLPRQDQLQEMVGEGMMVNLESRFHRYLMTEFYAPLKEQQPSMEQLWLAFYMYTQYNKKWDSKKEGWVDGQEKERA